MTALGTLRRRPWIAGLLLLTLAAGLVAPLALRWGSRYWPFYVGIAAVWLLVFGWIEKLWKTPRPPRPPRNRSKLRVLPGGRGNGHDKEFDLAKDDSTDKQRWLM
jgi:hypothetical protein